MTYSNKGPVRGLLTGYDRSRLIGYSEHVIIGQRARQGDGQLAVARVVLSRTGVIKTTLCRVHRREQIVALKK